MAQHSRIILDTDLPGVTRRARGKVRDVYEIDGKILIVATDRISAFDYILPTGIPDKGRVLTQLSVFWFDFLGSLAPNHFVTANVDEYPDPLPRYRDQLEGRSMLVKSARMVNVECVARGYLSGSIDGVLRVPGPYGHRYVVVDYKTNRLGQFDAPNTAADYTEPRLADAMTHSDYPLQALLYSVVLHRFLRWRLPDYAPEHHLGGVMYLFVRGMCGPQTPVVGGHPCGVFSWQPPVALVTRLSDLLDLGVQP